MPTNGIMFQAFHWFLDKDDSTHGNKTLWRFLKEEAKHLRDIGIDAVWIPPVYKGGGTESNGYDVYDHYDLGEFNTNGSKRTKFGNKNQLNEAIRALHQHNIQVYADIVMNHMEHGKLDDTWWQAIRTNPGDRTQERWEGYEGGIIEVKGYTKFDYPERNGAYSNFTWNACHFDAIDWVEQIRQNGEEFTANQVKSERKKGYVYRFLYNELGYHPGYKSYDEWVSLEKGNYDYLMSCDLDFDRFDVKEEMKQWGEWLTKQLDLDGYRIDAVKHINADYLREWLGHVRWFSGKQNVFVVTEHYTMDNVNRYISFLDRISSHGQYPQLVSAFDFPLRTKFRDASYGDYDLRSLNQDTLTSVNPTSSVTFVENHDKQFGRSMNSHVQNWFKPMAYAFILLRERGYPCVFWPDYYGSHDKDHHVAQPEGKEYLELLFKLRKQFSLGEERYYQDDFDGNIIGWLRMGFVPGAKGAMAVVMNNGNSVKAIYMDTGRTNRKFYHLATIKYVNDHFLTVKSPYGMYGDKAHELWTDNNGWAGFPADRKTVSIWLEDGTGLD